jgi:DNA repair protein RecN (Recombination protein N)
MLIEFRVENFGLMDDIRLNLGSGLTAFTGETGAGKSMLVDALGVLLGGRATTDYIRHGMEKANVEGIFTNIPEAIAEMLVDEGYPLDDGLLFLAREINNQGRNLCRVQGRIVPLNLYKTFCQGLVDIHGQMEHQSLLRSDSHMELLDKFGGQEHLKLVKKVREAAQKYKSILNQERELLRSERDMERREEILRFQIEEINKIDPKLGEDQELEQEKKFLQNAEKIINLALGAYDKLYSGKNGESSFDLMGIANRNLQELCLLDADCQQIAAQLDSIYYNLEDIINQLRNYQDNLDFEPSRLEYIENRLFELHKLRKYGLDIESILENKDKMINELEELVKIQDDKENIRREKKDALQGYNDLAEALTLYRGFQADKIEKGLARELADLGMENARIEVIFTPVTEPSMDGAEEIEFHFTANYGEPLKQLAKVVSGGEMARLMLAFKSMMSKVETVDTFIFDEVDSGVGGRTIKKVAEKLTAIAESKQVICITHSAMLAGAAQKQYALSKEVVDGRTVTKVSQLNEEQRVKELARMFGGEEVAINLADELRRQNNN